MPKNYSVIDLKPKGLSVLDVKSRNFSVVDTKSKNLNLTEVDDVVVYLGRGMSVGPGWFMYVTYPQTIATHP